MSGLQEDCKKVLQPAVGCIIILAFITSFLQSLCLFVYLLYICFCTRQWKLARSPYVGGNGVHSRKARAEEGEPSRDGSISLALAPCQKKVPPAWPLGAISLGDGKAALDVARREE
jgi:hypothetical protein